MNPILNNPILEATGLSFSFRNRPIYQGLDMVIPRGKVTVLMGPSGCGKSTFLALAGGRLQPAQGEIKFDGQPIPKKAGDDMYAMRRRMGMLFQNSALLTDLSVYDNVAFPLREQTNLPEEIIRLIVLLKLEMVGLRGARNMMPSELSGGMSRRVALARAIALDPDVIMYDEPFVGLDPISMAVIVKLIRELNDALKVTSVIVTHDVAEGCSIADYVYLLGGGRVVGHGTPDEMINSSDPAISQFINGNPDGPVGFHYPASEMQTEIRNSL